MSNSRATKAVKEGGGAPRRPSRKRPIRLPLSAELKSCGASFRELVDQMGPGRQRGGGGGVRPHEAKTAANFPPCAMARSQRTPCRGVADYWSGLAKARW